MHIEIIVEDSSGARLLEVLLPRILGEQGEPHTWRLHAYKGIGRIPQGLVTKDDPSKRMLLNQLPKLLRGYRKTHGIDAVVVVLDTDKRDCVTFLAELKAEDRTTFIHISFPMLRALWDLEILIASRNRVGQETRLKPYFH